MTDTAEPRRRTLSVAWNPRSWSRARAAFVVQLDTDPPGEPTLLRWIVAALEEHAARSPQARAALAAAPRADHPAGPSTQSSPVVRRVHKVDDDLVQLVDDAVSTDRRTCGRFVSRSAWISQAVDAAADTVEATTGAPLPGPPADIPRGAPAGAPRRRASRRL